MEIKKILGVYDSNTFVVKKDGCCLIVDSGANFDEVKLAVGDCKVVGVFLTHGHFDHALNALNYANAFGCKVFASDKIIEIISSPKKNYGETFYVDSFEKFDFLQGDIKLCVDCFNIEVLATPGHTPCSVCYLIDGQLFAGDTVFDGGIGRVDLIGSSKNDMVKSLQKLQTVKFEHCHSGHGQSSNYDRQERNLKAFLRYLTR